MIVKNFKDLVVWQKAYTLVLDIYCTTGNYPHDERYVLCTQMKRSAVSVVSNIAEGYQRFYSGDYLKFLSISLGSCAELETQLMLSKDLNFITNDKFTYLHSHLSEISKMLNSMRNSLKSSRETWKQKPENQD